MSDNQVPPPPGYYDDGSGQQKYWDGQSWTDTTFSSQFQSAAPGQSEPSDQAPESSDQTPGAYGQTPGNYGQTPQSSDQASGNYGQAPGTYDQASGNYAQAPGSYDQTPGTYGQTPGNYGQAPGTYGTYLPGAPSEPKQRNVLGIIALALAVVGFVFACIPGALVIGWVALPIAFILSIVALFRKGQGKGLAVTALIVSVVGTIVGVIVFFTVVGNSFNDAFGGTSSSGVQSTSATSTKGSRSASSSNQPGSRSNPAAIGSPIQGDDYTVTIDSVNLNATDAVLAANQFNDKPDAGTNYALVTATVTYNGSDKGYTSDVQIDYVTASGNVIDPYVKTVVPPDPNLASQELYTGAKASGNTVLQVPTGDNGLLRVTPGFSSDEFFVKLK